jgi:hypothetical protein
MADKGMRRTRRPLSESEKELLEWLRSFTHAQVAWALLFVLLTVRFDAVVSLSVCLVVYLLRIDG